MLKTNAESADAHSKLYFCIVCKDLKEPVNVPNDVQYKFFKKNMTRFFLNK